MTDDVGESRSDGVGDGWLEGTGKGGTSSGASIGACFILPLSSACDGRNLGLKV